MNGFFIIDDAPQMTPQANALFVRMRLLAIGGLLAAASLAAVIAR